MPCPHGNGPPERCSQCLAPTVARYEIRGGAVFIDGVEQGTAAAHMKAADESLLNKPALRRGGNAPRSCSICRLPGHNAKTCNRRR